MNRSSQTITRVVIIVTLALSAWAQFSTMNAMNAISVSTTGYSSQAIQAENDFQLETASDTTVYQQQVSAAWSIKDMTHAVADEVSRTTAISAAILWSQNITNWLLAAIVSLVGLLLLSRKPVAEPTASKVAPVATRKPKGTDTAVK
jgi:hypothetical protein